MGCEVTAKTTRGMVVMSPATVPESAYSWPMRPMSGPTAVIGVRMTMAKSTMASTMRGSRLRISVLLS